MIIATIAGIEGENNFSVSEVPIKHLVHPSSVFQRESNRLSFLYSNIPYISEYTIGCFASYYLRISKLRGFSYNRKLLRGSFSVSTSFEEFPLGLLASSSMHSLFCLCVSFYIDCFSIYCFYKPPHALSKLLIVRYELSQFSLEYIRNGVF